MCIIKHIKRVPELHYFARSILVYPDEYRICKSGRITRLLLSGDESRQRIGNTPIETRILPPSIPAWVSTRMSVWRYMVTWSGSQHYKFTYHSFALNGYHAAPPPSSSSSSFSSSSPSPALRFCSVRGMIVCICALHVLLAISYSSQSSLLAS